GVRVPVGAAGLLAGARERGVLAVEDAVEAGRAVRGPHIAAGALAGGAEHRDVVALRELVVLGGGGGHVALLALGDLLEQHLVGRGHVEADAGRELRGGRHRLLAAEALVGGGDVLVEGAQQPLGEAVVARDLLPGAKLAAGEVLRPHGVA
ncbi:MAG: hypothetical protein ACK559_40085, partial [bacterium]